MIDPDRFEKDMRSVFGPNTAEDLKRNKIEPVKPDSSRSQEKKHDVAKHNRK